MKIDIYDEVNLYRTLEAHIGRVIDFTILVSRAFGGSGMQGLLEKNGSEEYTLRSPDRSCVLIFHIESIKTCRIGSEERLFLDLNI